MCVSRCKNTILFPAFSSPLLFFISLFGLVSTPCTVSCPLIIASPLLFCPFLLLDFCSQFPWFLLYFFICLHLIYLAFFLSVFSLHIVKLCHAWYTLRVFAHLFNLHNPFAYSCNNFPPRLHLNNTKPVCLSAVKLSYINEYNWTYSSRQKMMPTGV